MYKLLIAFTFTLIVAGCSQHSHSHLQEHWHSCDGEMFYTPIEYDDQLKSCSELIKEEILEELKT